VDDWIRTNSGAPLITPWAPPGMSQAKYDRVTQQAAQKKEVADDAQQALSSPKLSASEQAKSRAKSEIQAIMKRLNVLKKLFSADPKQMAKALAQVFRELKAALKAYKDALKDEQSLGGDLVSGVLTAQATAGAPTSDGSGGATPSDTTTQPGAADPAPSRSDPQGLYNSVLNAYQQQLGADGLDFVKTLRATVQEIEDKIVSAARIQAKGRPKDKATDEAFKDMDGALKDLRKDMDDMDRDLKQAAPAAGSSLDVAA
jgi:Sec-independent protein translocase protein TatA